MSKEVAEVLTKARNILEDLGWTQACFAKDKNGLAVDFDNSEATCFCSAGAIWKATGLDTSCTENPLERACTNQLSEAMSSDIIGNNDHKDTKLIHILMAFDFAILMAKENKVTV
jgi:hypothetical protein